MPIAPGAAARLRHYLSPTLAASAVYPVDDHGFQHSVANQLHYMTSPKLVGLVPSHRVMDCSAMVRKALFDEMTVEAQQAVRSRLAGTDAPEAFDEVCNLRVVYDVAIETRLEHDAHGVVVCPASNLSTWTLRPPLRFETTRLRLNDIVSIEGRVIPLDRFERAWHHALVEIPTDADTNGMFWRVPLAEHDAGACIGTKQDSALTLQGPRIGRTILCSRALCAWSQTCLLNSCRCRTPRRRSQLGSGLISSMFSFVSRSRGRTRPCSPPCIPRLSDLFGLPR